MKEQDVKQVYKTLQLEKDGFGEVQISGEVVASIAGLAALEVNGIQSTIGSMGHRACREIWRKEFRKRR